MSSQAHLAEEVEGSVDPRSIKYEEKYDISKGVAIDIIFNDVEYDNDVCLIFCTIFQTLTAFASL